MVYRCCTVSTMPYALSPQRKIYDMFQNLNSFYFNTRWVRPKYWWLQLACAIQVACAIEIYNLWRVVERRSLWCTVACAIGNYRFRKCVQQSNRWHQLAWAIKSINFGESFNQPINVNWPAQLKSMTFGYSFNQPINDVNWPQQWQSLIFGNIQGFRMYDLGRFPLFNQAINNVTLLLRRNYLITLHILSSYGLWKSTHQSVVFHSKKCHT